MVHGRQHKTDTVKCLKMSQGIDIQKCGLFKDKETLYLGASPDGLVGNDTILQIKFPSSCNKTVT